MDIIDVHIRYDADKVCSSCGTNNSIHYNHFIFHGSRYANPDLEVDAWCGKCSGPCELIKPELLEDESAYQ